MDLEGADTFANVPTPVQFLNFCCTFVHIELKHLFPHCFNLDESITKRVCDIAGKGASLIPLEEVVEFREAIEAATDYKAFKVLLDMGSGLVHRGLYRLILIELSHQVDFHHTAVVYLRLQGK